MFVSAVNAEEASRLVRIQVTAHDLFLESYLISRVCVVSGRRWVLFSFDAFVLQSEESRRALPVPSSVLVAKGGMLSMVKGWKRTF